MLRRSVVLAPALLLAGCAALPGAEPPRVTLAGVEPLPGESLEMRAAVKLRVQNPGDAPIDFDGVSLELLLRGMSFASGVSDARGTIPRFSETVVSVPVSVSALAVLRQALSLVGDAAPRLDFVARGRLGGGLLGGASFETRGELEWPTGTR
ncbi:MAG: LEA type 2 family protein [Rubrivivax sp.]|jgi:hypothetical protein|nr:LEA type 2 family protein [Rubrivivax sp.]